MRRGIIVLLIAASIAAAVAVAAPRTAAAGQQPDAIRGLVGVEMMGGGFALSGRGRAREAFALLTGSVAVADLAADSWLAFGGRGGFALDPVPGVRSSAWLFEAYAEFEWLAVDGKGGPWLTVLGQIGPSFAWYETTAFTGAAERWAWLGGVSGIGLRLYAGSVAITAIGGLRGAGSGGAYYYDGWGAIAIAVWWR